MNHLTRIKILEKLEAGQLTSDEAFHYLKKIDASSVSEVSQEVDINTRSQEYIEKLLKELLAQEMKLPIEKVNIHETFENYGLDSIMILRLNKELGLHFGELPKTLLFEYKSIEELSKYFLTQQKEKVLEKLQIEVKNQSSSILHKSNETEAEIQASKVKSVRKRFSERTHKSSGPTDKLDQEIAIIGVSGRYPMADNLNEFWENLKKGKDCITEVPESRWDSKQYFDEDKSKKGKSYIKWGGFIKDVDKFDPLFFNISAREATLMDPQERLFLETVWHTMEDAGYTKESLAQTAVGVFVGVMYGQYQLYGTDQLNQGQAVPNSVFASIANRVSYFLDFHGPSIALDTMCSSSLTAIHLACDSIRKGESDLAFAGGVNLSIHPNKYVLLSQGKFVSSDGKCRSFGKGGDGFVPGEGVGAILLKPLSKAIEDGDQIYAVIKSLAINHGGRTNGYSVPNPTWQGKLVDETLQKANIDPRSISYIEAHGTGTSLGDPIEIEGLAKAFGENDDKQFCAIGSVKSNIGHLESAAAMAGITKILLQMKHKQLVPSLHAEELNPNINFNQSPFHVQHELSAWEKPVLVRNGLKQEFPRRAGLSSFGAGGANAHIILEEYEPAPEELAGVQHPQIIVLSAKNEVRLKEYAYRMSQFLKKEQKVALQDVAFTLQVGRQAMEVRWAVVVDSKEQLIEALESYHQGDQERNFIFNDIKQQAPRKSFNDKAGQAYLNILYKNADLVQIAHLWSTGVEIDWQALHTLRKPRRVSLVGYPFERERYWIKNTSSVLAEQHQKESHSRISSSMHEDLDRSYHKESNEITPSIYSPKWKQVVIPKRMETGLKSKHVVIVYHEEALGLETVIDREHRNDQITKLMLGKETKQLSSSLWEIDVAQETALEECIGNLAHIDLIYFLGGLEAKVDDMTDLNRLDITQERGVISLFRLVKGLSKHNYTNRDLEIKVMTNNSHLVLETDAVNPYGASLLGFTKSVAKEYTKWKMLVLDICTKNHGSDVNEIKGLQQWLGSWKYESTNEVAEIALREGLEYQRSLYPIQVKNNDQNTVFRRRGVYLIVGGAGGIGMEATRYLSEFYQARIVLIGRSPLNQEKLQMLQQIEEKGGTVQYIQADASNETEMRQAVERTKETFGVLHGVIHSAIVLRDRSIEFMDELTLKSVLTPKVKGSVVLHNVLRGEQLDFMIYFSSAQSFSGNAGQSNYAAACTFKDSFAHYLQQQVTYPVTIINWGYWGTVGVVSSDMYNQKLAAQGIYSITPDEGMDLLQRILTNGLHQALPIKATGQILDSLGVEHFSQEPSFSVQHESLHIDDIRRSMPKVEDYGIDNIKRGLQEFTLFCHELLLDVFQKLGLFREENIKYSKAELEQHLRILPKYHRLLNELLEMLERGRYIDIDGDVVVSTHKVTKNELERLEEKREQLVSTYPEIKAHIQLVWICIQQFEKVLTGQLPATDVMFDNASMDLVKGIYQGNRAADYYNDLVLWGVQSYIVENLPLLQEGEKIKILEVGGGTGGTSATVLKGIKIFGDDLNYTYSDVSAAFTMFGKKEYGPEYPFVDFKILDIEKSVVEQGYTLGDYDIIIATNVLHATKNMEITLHHISQLLASKGLVIINEGTANHDFLTLTFGLLDGWWLYEDEENRLKGSPLIDLSTWEQLLIKKGFHPLHLLGEIGDEGTGQNVIIAESASIVQSTSLEESLSKVDISIEEIEAYVQESILESLSSVLEIDKGKFDLHSPYTDFGVDSILAVEIINQLNQTLQTTLRTTDLFNFSSVSELTSHLITKFRTGLEIEYAKRIKSDQVGGLKFRSQTEETEFRVDSTKENKNVSLTKGMDIAVVGVSAKFPDAEDVNEFWINLANGIDSVKEINRWGSSFYDEDPQAMGKSYCKYGGLLSGVDEFDPYFFNISPKEAEFMDPRQRLFLQEAWKAIEDAGYSIKELEDKKCGVFVGAGTGDYSKLIEGHPEGLGSYAFMGNSDSIMAARISYFLNLKGPSLAIDTACSSSLVAIHMACESILSGTCDMALAGGVEVLATPQFHILASNAGMLSPSGQCRTFDYAANGFVPGEGVGTVLLKKLEDALRDGDHIYGVIKGSGMNQDGKTNGITAPSAPSQTDLICEVYRTYDIHPETIGYVEAHGTGTKLGDPIEVDALTDAFGQYTHQKQFCALGSVKTNLGHTLAAAGLAGFIKVLLSLKHKLLVPSLHFEKQNDFIDLQASAFYVNTELKTWEAKAEHSRRAALSAFGFSGTNVHMVLEEYTMNRTQLVKTTRPYYPIVLSAKTDDSLQKKVEDMIQWLQQEGQEEPLADLAYTLLVGRNHFSHRMAFIVQSKEELLKKFIALQDGSTSDVFQNKMKESVFKAQKLKQDYGDKLVDELLETSAPNIYSEKLQQILELYIEGYSFNWRVLFEGTHVQRISLPTYPFEKGQYWIKQVHPTQMEHHSPIEIGETLHPLVHKNISTLREQKYKTTLYGNEFYLEDHVIFDQKILPGVAYLELARAAIELAAEGKVYLLNHIVWASPVTLDDEPKDIYISIYPQEHDDSAYEIYSFEKDGSRVLHSQGTACYLKGVKPALRTEEKLPIQMIKNRCSANKIMGDEIYSFIREKGLDLGSRLQAINEIVGNRREALSFLTLPTKIIETLETFILHPTLMDAALLSIAGLKTEEGKNRLYVPFSMGSVELHRPITPNCFVYVTIDEREAEVDFSISKFQISILDEEGHLLVKINDFLGRIVEKEIGGSDSDHDAQVLEMFEKIKSGELEPDVVEHMTEVSRR